MVLQFKTTEVTGRNSSIYSTKREVFKIGYFYYRKLWCRGSKSGTRSWWKTIAWRDCSHLCRKFRPWVVLHQEAWLLQVLQSWWEQVHHSPSGQFRFYDEHGQWPIDLASLRPAARSRDYLLRQFPGWDSNPWSLPQKDWNVYCWIERSSSWEKFSQRHSKA